MGDDNLNKFQTMWTMRQADLVAKERLSQLSLLNSLIGKKEHLADSCYAEMSLLIFMLCSCYGSVQQYTLGDKVPFSKADKYMRESTRQSCHESREKGHGL
ncbi:hypothetical protein F2Q70_00043846 [Brassica cretica]|uniref:Uncharacterized protein n=1 Tax=Brassica cretica TaxID=69181 RepID=A0A8S9KFQ5_BRACR|nr:hypothetical protein F2Q70_00043846 [Brassica cretica]